VGFVKESHGVQPEVSEIYYCNACSKGVFIDHCKEERKQVPSFPRGQSASGFHSGNII
jgi:hypothetical protein